MVVRQLALNGGAIPVCVVSSPEKAELCRRMGADLVIDRATEDFRFWKDAHQGKVAVRCLAPEEGLGVRDPELRARPESAINRFRGR